MVDVDAAVVTVVEDTVLLPKQHGMEPFLQSMVKLSHSLEVVFQERGHQILSKIKQLELLLLVWV